MKTLNYVLGALFVIAAALQWNDPDPLVWIPLYLLAAFLCFKAARGIYYPRLYLGGITLYTVYAFLLFFGEDGVLSWIRDHDQENLVQTMKATKPWIEKTREFGGLLIMIAALALNHFSSRRGTVRKNARG